MLRIVLLPLIGLLARTGHARLNETAFQDPKVIIGLWEKENFEGNRSFFNQDAFSLSGLGGCVNINWKAFNISSFARRPTEAPRDSDAWRCFLYKHENCKPCGHPETPGQVVVYADNNTPRMEFWAGTIQSLRCCNATSPGVCGMNMTAPLGPAAPLPGVPTVDLSPSAAPTALPANSSHVPPAAGIPTPPISAPQAACTAISPSPPTPAPRTPVSTSSSARLIVPCPDKVRVLSGDTCEGIAKRCDITLDAFRKANPTINEKCDNLIVDTDVFIRNASEAASSRMPIASIPLGMTSSVALSRATTSPTACAAYGTPA